jgi:hypothetical protein
MFRSFWVSSWASSKNTIKNDTTVLVLATQDASPLSFLGETSFSFFTNHTLPVKSVRGLVQFDLFNFNYNRDADSAQESVISFHQDETSSVRCEDCYLYLGGGFGLEYETGIGVPPLKFAKGMSFFEVAMRVAEIQQSA